MFALCSYRKLNLFSIKATFLHHQHQIPLTANDLDMRGDWAEGTPIDMDEYRRMLVLWIEDTLNDLILHGHISPGDIHIEPIEIGGYRVPLIRVFGQPKAMFWPYLEKEMN
tara:strand:+ start:137 stop:469 length:333 start_codon:yes stop_codon:yes gene_type:complete